MQASQPDVFTAIQAEFKGEFHTSSAMRRMYATDASSYRELPLAVAFPRDVRDIQALIRTASRYGIGLIPRTAGTSLAGQVVGSGIVVDVSRTFTEILEINTTEHWVRVQPGVVRDELNRFLEPYGLYFGPETSTANRAMIGGMVGNNSCGSNSVVYGSTREHCLEIHAVLSDGSKAIFGSLSKFEFDSKCEQQNLEGEIYRSVRLMLGDASNRQNITAEFPKPSIPRRNTGYALDKLMACNLFAEDPEQFNFCKLLCGSEGTLAFVTEIKLSLVPLPPAEKVLICAHFDSVDEALHGNLVALKYQPSAVELMDHHVLNCTKDSLSQRKNRFFLQGDPKAILVIEIARNNTQEMQRDADALIADLKEQNFGFHYPTVIGADIKKVWSLRKAGLGLLSNTPGDAKPVPVIEDTAVDVEDLPAYIRDFNELLAKHNRYCVHYAHAGSGELHLRPILNLKSAEGQRLFRVIAEEIATLVKKYRGSLSGEHGDGRLRGEFLKQMIGAENYKLLIQLKKTWDPGNVMNPGKIVHSPPMDSSLRFEKDQDTRTFDTAFKFRKEKGILRTTEQCNGSGDCRKSHLAGGTMCPSYQVSHNEKDTTRARANVLREVLTRSSEENPFSDPDIGEVMKLCLSCKGCTGECPSNVDMTRLKSEWQFQLFKEKGFPLRNRLFGHTNRLNRIGSKLPSLANFALRGPFAGLTKSFLGVSSKRSLPEIASESFAKWFKKTSHELLRTRRGSVLLYADAFTNYLDVEIGIAAVRLLTGLGYEVQLAPCKESGRTYLSKGMLVEAKGLAEFNVNALQPLISAERPLIGIEPSAVLSFVDEYPDLVTEELLDSAKMIAANTYLIEDFIASEFKAGRIVEADFDTHRRDILLHGHCHQKALCGVEGSVEALSIPVGHTVTTIPSGCCGMAGSFGYEKEHYEMSMQIGELVLFPAIRASSPKSEIAAAGTSCRHQIKDGTGKLAKHPVQFLLEALAD